MCSGLAVPARHWHGPRAVPVGQLMERGFACGCHEKHEFFCGLWGQDCLEARPVLCVPITAGRGCPPWAVGVPRTARDPEPSLHPLRVWGLLRGMVWGFS